MELREYQMLAERTANKEDELRLRLVNWCLGLAGESGEVIDLVKKHAFHGHKLQHDHIADELGDVLWYIANLASDLGLDLQTIAEMNVEKLRRRYPEGFDKLRSINREERRS